MKRIGLLSVALAATVAVACGGDRGDYDANKPNSGAAVGTAGDRAGEDVNRGARRFLEEMVAGNYAEVELGKLASERAASNEVKGFARMMVEDHSKALEALRQTATQHNIQAPEQLNDDARDLRDRLSKLSGTEFDPEYMNAMVDKHERTAEALEDRIEENNGNIQPKQNDNPVESRLNQWAAETLPTVRKHLERARQIRDTMGRRTTERQ